MEKMKIAGMLLVAVSGSAIAGSPCDDTATEIGPWTAATTFVPDARPVIHVPLWNADYADNCLGMASGWYDNDEVNSVPEFTDGDSNSVPDVFDDLLDSLNDIYDRGFRRINLTLPAGNIQEDEYALMPSSQWMTMAEWKRQGFEDHIKPWIAAKGDVDMGIYMGFEIGDPNSLRSVDSVVPDTTRMTDMAVFNQNVQPWIDLGFTEIHFDYSSPSTHWQTFLEIQQSPDYVNDVKFVGEAIPLAGTGSGCNRDMDTTAIDASPWLAAFNVAEARHTDELALASNRELHLLLSGHAASGCGYTGRFTFDKVVDYFEAGWVLNSQYGLDNRVWLQDPNATRPISNYITGAIPMGVERVQRFYGIGKITATADFDADGKINLDPTDPDSDQSQFTAAWSSLLAHILDSKPGGYADGDIDGNGIVDLADITAFTIAADEWNNNGVVKGMDLDTQTPF